MRLIVRVLAFAMLVFALYLIVNAAVFGNRTCLVGTCL